MRLRLASRAEENPRALRQAPVRFPVHDRNTGVVRIGETDTAILVGSAFFRLGAVLAGRKAHFVPFVAGSNTTCASQLDRARLPVPIDSRARTLRRAGD